jgi:hypothetical protein
MEQGLLEWGPEPAADGGTARQAPVHRLHTGTPDRICAAQAEAEYPGEAEEAGYLEAEEAAAGGVSRHRITPTHPMHSLLQHLMQSRK